MKSFKKLLSLVLSAVMVASVLPMSAMAGVTKPTIISGMRVIIKPHITHHIPVVLNTVSANPCPEEMPTEAKKRHIPNSRINSDADDEV